MNNTVVFDKIRSSDSTPRYVQTRQIIIDAIREGRLPAGSKLPSTKKIGSLVNVSLITAHKALESLVESGWLRREVGRGTYVRNDLDLSVAARPRLHISLLMDRRLSINNYYHSNIIEGLRSEARADSYEVDFFFHDHFSLRNSAKSDNMGLICIHPPQEAKSDVERLAERYPVLVLGRTFADGRVSCIDCDNFNGARRAVQHLVEFGHRRLLMLSGSMNLSNARERAVGVFFELKQHDLQVRHQDLLISNNTEALDQTTKQQLLHRMKDGARPTAIVAGDYGLAISALQILREAGFSIPQDVSLIGFDDPLSASLLNPPLTTIRQPLQQMAGTAYRMLRTAVEGDRSPLVPVRLPTELIVRESVGPVP